MAALAVGCAPPVKITISEPAGGSRNLTVDRDRTVNEEFQLVLSREGYELYYRDSTAEIAVKDVKRGDMWYSNPQDRESDPLAAGQASDLLASQLQLRYFKNESTMETMDSYRFSTSLIQHAFRVEGDTLRVTYRLGQSSFSLDYIPQALSKKSMDKVLNALDDDEADEMKKRYEYYALEETDESLRGQLIHDFPLVEQTPLYIRKNFPEYVGEQLYAMFQKAGYTRDDLLADNKENGIDKVIEEPVSITLSLVYALIDGGFTVTVPSADITGDDKTPVTDIALLPFFGCGGTQDEGQLLVPDGSGALIRFNNGKVTADGYEQKIYCRDLALSQQNQDAPSQPALLPVFGIGRNGGGFVASIDGGYESAYVMAGVAGKAVSYNHVYGSFRVRAYDQVSMGGEGSSENMKYNFPVQRNAGDLTVAYLFTDGAELSDMADVYRSYLVERGVLTQKAEGKTALNLELTATVPEKKNFFGIQYEALGKTTGYQQAVDILNALGVEGADVRLLGALDGGKYQKRADKASPLGLLGRRDALRELESRCGRVYFNLNIQTADTAPKSMEARALSKDVAKLYSYDPISRYYEYNKRYQVLLSPWKFEEIAASAAIRLERGGVKALTVEDIAYQANSDFNRERQAEPAIAVAKSRAALESLAADFDLSVQYGGFHTLGIAEKIWNIPDTSSRFAVEDESVPFYQMVIHGYIPYCLPPVNDAADSREALLRSVEYGAELQYALVYRNVEKPVDNADRFYNKLYTHYVEEIPAFYAESRAVLSAVSNQCMVKRENVNANAVAITYENGAVVVVNYAPDALTYENREIPGRSFALLDAAA